MTFTGTQHAVRFAILLKKIVGTCDTFLVKIQTIG
jgi:hypothetical protein